MMLPLLLVLALYRPEYWQYYPSMDEVRCISPGTSELYVAVPDGVYILKKSTLQIERTLTRSDGIAGSVLLCVQNQSRGDVYIATDEYLYRFVPATGLLEPLSPPFKGVSSIGTNAQGMYFVTDAGWFARMANSQEFAPAAEFPRDVNWFGASDTLNARDYPALAPFFVTDEQLVSHELGRVRPDRNGRRLYVAANGYGIVVIDPRSGFTQARARFGPTYDPVSRVAQLDGRLWFISNDQAVTVDSAGDWQYFLTKPGYILAPGFRLLLGSVSGLNRNERITALLGDAGSLFFGTERGIYQLGSDHKLAELTQFPRAVTGLARFGDTLLVGSEYGLFMYLGDSVLPVNDPYWRTDWGVYDIARSDAGTYYFGTLGGAVSLALDHTWNRYMPPGFDLSQPVSHIAAAGSFVFMGSPSGLTALNTTDNSWTTIELPSQTVTGLFADSRYLWIS
jgi:hypothetical protein